MTKKHTIEHVRSVIGAQFPGYSLLSADYSGVGQQLLLTCPRHGQFNARFGDLARGHGCPTCGREKQIKTRISRTKVKTLEALQRLHPNLTFPFFDAEYTCTTSWITVRCPLHGDVRKQPHKMISRKDGCPLCGAERSRLSRTYTHDEVLSNFTSSHGSRYDYSKVILNGYMTPVTIICRIHGEFQQSPQQHSAGQGCPKCAPLGRKQNQIKPFDEYVDKANRTHANKYSYVESSYTGFSGKVEVVCPSHGPFFANGFDHLYGSGCPQCSMGGFKPHLPAWLYVYQINVGGVESVGFGITNDITRRDYVHQITFRAGGATGTLLGTWYFASGQKCRELESEILKKFDSFDTGLSGFHREATFPNNLQPLISFVSSFHAAHREIPA